MFYCGQLKFKPHYIREQDLFISFWAIAIVLWQTRGNIFYLFNFGYIGTFKMDIGGNEHIQRRNRRTRP